MTLGYRHVAENTIQVTGSCDEEGCGRGRVAYLPLEDFSQEGAAENFEGAGWVKTGEETWACPEHGAERSA